MKTLILVTSILTGCTSVTKGSAVGMLVEVREYSPKLLERCSVVTTLILQTAQSGRTEIELPDVPAAEYAQWKGHNVEITWTREHIWGCAKASATIKEAK
jgi:hypothetical protein